MRSTLIALSLLGLAACNTRSPAPTNPPPNPTAASSPTEMDFAAYAGRDMTVVDFLHACQQASGFNFTYTEATAEALTAASLRLPEAKHVPAADFPGYLETRLSSAGFVCRRVGPENLRVYLVERRAT